MNLHWLFAFGLTQLIEAPIYYRALGRAHGQAELGSGVPAAPSSPVRPPVERALLALLPSALTHPMLWFALFPPFYQWMGYWPSVVVCELLVVLAEGLILWPLLRTGPLKAASWAFAANLTSVVIGLVTSRLFGWP